MNRETRVQSALKGRTTKGVFLLTMMLSACASAQTKVKGADPRSPIELYFQAHAFGDGDYIRQAFAPDPRVMFVEKDIMANEAPQRSRNIE